MTWKEALAEVLGKYKITGVFVGLGVNFPGAPKSLKRLAEELKCTGVQADFIVDTPLKLVTAVVEEKIEPKRVRKIVGLTARAVDLYKMEATSQGEPVYEVYLSFLVNTKNSDVPEVTDAWWFSTSLSARDNSYAVFSGLILSLWDSPEECKEEKDRQLCLLSRAFPHHLFLTRVYVKDLTKAFPPPREVGVAVEEETEEEKGEVVPHLNVVFRTLRYLLDNAAEEKSLKGFFKEPAQMSLPNEHKSEADELLGTLRKSWEELERVLAFPRMVEREDYLPDDYGWVSQVLREYIKKQREGAQERGEERGEQNRSTLRRILKLTSGLKIYSAHPLKVNTDSDWVWVMGLNAGGKSTILEGLYLTLSGKVARWDDFGRLTFQEPEEWEYKDIRRPAEASPFFEVVAKGRFTREELEKALRWPTGGNGGYPFIPEQVSFFAYGENVGREARYWTLPSRLLPISVVSPKVYFTLSEALSDMETAVIRLGAGILNALGLEPGPLQLSTAYDYLHRLFTDFRAAFHPKKGLLRHELLYGTYKKSSGEWETLPVQLVYVEGWQILIEKDVIPLRKGKKKKSKWEESDGTIARLEPEAFVKSFIRGVLGGPYEKGRFVIKSPSRLLGVYWGVTWGDVLLKLVEVVSKLIGETGTQPLKDLRILSEEIWNSLQSSKELEEAWNDYKHEAARILTSATEMDKPEAEKRAKVLENMPWKSVFSENEGKTIARALLRKKGVLDRVVKEIYKTMGNKIRVGVLESAFKTLMKTTVKILLFLHILESSVSVVDHFWLAFDRWASDAFPAEVFSTLEAILNEVKNSMGLYKPLVSVGVEIEEGGRLVVKAPKMPRRSLREILNRGESSMTALALFLIRFLRQGFDEKMKFSDVIVIDDPFLEMDSTTAAGVARAIIRFIRLYRHLTEGQPQSIILTHRREMSELMYSQLVEAQERVRYIWIPPMKRERGFLQAHILGDYPQDEIKGGVS